MLKYSIRALAREGTVLGCGDSSLGLSSKTAVGPLVKAGTRQPSPLAREWDLEVVLLPYRPRHHVTH